MMNEPKRWSELQSEVNPVLRSVTRYAQRLEPDAAAVQRLILATANQQATKRPRAALKRFSMGVVIGLAAAFGGVAWASYGKSWFWGPSRTVGAPPSFAPAATKPRQPALATPSALASEPASATPLPRAGVAAGAPSVVSAPPSAVSAPPSADSAQADSALLQRARGDVASRPSRALTLTRDHEVRFPASPLGEERHALRIEALARLGRGTEVASELQAFEARYPRSPYRRRLRSLATP